MMRRDIERTKGKEKIAEIPVFLILGGQAGTGKTKLLSSISRLVGNGGRFEDFKNIKTKEHRVLYDLFYSDNLMPIFIDEIPESFFRDSGENLIKNVANSLVTHHPILIGTTNQEFSAESQVVRRLYYLHFDNPVNQDAKKQAEEYFEKEVGELNDRLFRHFISEMLALISEKDEYFKMEDPVFYGRQIFTRLFAEAGIERPAFLSKVPLGDYYKIGSLEWYSFYENNKDRFKEIKREEELLLSIDLDQWTN